MSDAARTQRRGSGKPWDTGAPDQQRSTGKRMHWDDAMMSAAGGLTAEHVRAARRCAGRTGARCGPPTADRDLVRAPGCTYAAHVGAQVDRRAAACLVDHTCTPRSKPQHLASAPALD